MDQRELDRRWFTWEPIEGVRYGLNDTVRILSGKNAGLEGAIISLCSTEPVGYVVELLEPPYGDVELAEHDLELIFKHVNI